MLTRCHKRPTVVRMLQTTLPRMRVARGLKQVELARKLGVSRSTVCCWESGERTPSLDQATRLAQALGCTLDELVKPTLSA
ncbi:MAG: helix-turn-helix transcriptional regulator [Vulcanimicrobiota bacterium]